MANGVKPKGYSSIASRSAGSSRSRLGKRNSSIANVLQDQDDSSSSEDEGENVEARSSAFASDIPRREQPESNPQQRFKAIKYITEKAKRWQISESFLKKVIKCVLAYALASLCTYIPSVSHQLAVLLPNHDPSKMVPISNLHFIATVAVYFHPGRSVGGMMEANIFALFGFVYAITLALTSMTLAVYLHENDFPLTSNAISVILFVGIGTSLVGFARVRVGRPTFNTACSLIGVLIFTVIVKEGSSHLGHFSTDKIWQVTLVVFVGVLISNIVCFTIWPQSACTSLQYDIQRNLKSFSTLLRVLTKTFLMEDINEFSIKSKRIKAAIDNHHDSFISLKRDLEEAKLEAPFDQRIRGRISSYVRVVDSLNVLAQHLGGLRTSCTLQAEMVQSMPGHRARSGSGATSRAFTTSVYLDGDGQDTSITVQSPTGVDDPDEFITPKKSKPRQSAFDHYLETLGPHVRNLVSTCGTTLKGLTTTFEATVKGIDSHDGYKKDVQDDETFDVMAQMVRTAMKEFKHERTVAIKRSYSIYPRHSVDAESLAEMQGQKSDEDVFLIFYFLFLIEEFAKELESLIEALEVIRKDEKRIQEKRNQPIYSRILSSVTNLFGCRKDRWGRSSKEESFGSTVFALFIRNTPAFSLASPQPHQPDTSQTPAPFTKRQKLNWAVWRLGQFFKQPDTKFAIKTGLGCALLASPAFISSTRPLFTEFQAQWALISFLVVLSPTVGQSNQLSVHRIGGTVAGAVAATCAYWLFPDNNIALPIFGAIFSIPCFFWIIGKPQYASSGRFVLLTYNLTALYSYNIRKVGIEVEEIAIRRMIDVIVGVIWATLLNHLVWPTEARRELTRGVSELLFKLAFLYQKLVLAYSSAEAPLEERGDGFESRTNTIESQPLIERHGELSEIQTIELALQVSIIKLEGLLAQTRHEPRLKGPFPVEQYRRLLGCSQHILDLLHTMNLVTSRSDWHTDVRQDFIIPVDASGLRRKMVGNVSLFFWLLGSAFHLKTPLPPFLPPAEEARKAVLEKIRQLPAVKRRAIRGSSEYLLYFAYALSMKDLIHKLDEIGLIAQQLFGVMGGSVNGWNEQFIISHDEQERLDSYLQSSTDLSSTSNDFAFAEGSLADRTVDTFGGNR